MKFNLVSIVFLLASSLAQAQFHGLWKGTGSIQHISGWSAACSGLQMNILQSEDSLKINDFKYECEDYSSEWATKKMRVKGSEIWMDNEKVGDISESALHLEAHSPDGLYQTFDMKISDGKMEFYETWEYNEIQILVIQGTLHLLNTVQSLK